MAIRIESKRSENQESLSCPEVLRDGLNPFFIPYEILVSFLPLPLKNDRNTIVISSQDRSDQKLRGDQVSKGDRYDTTV
jgi:hypothetical protein